ncbi:hypothetical protein CDD81_6300 [Ophiocordyceps australis]|uniref:DUF7732 domain-containing protein n=1 Tax=Ophiocordyceps australis TaxID=1399860 RepID=A0A2C5Y0N9_9HYPO|nr:hypothetical protein CDD81_6300 [Ophiocordyceps australis]
MRLDLLLIFACLFGQGAASAIQPPELVASTDSVAVQEHDLFKRRGGGGGGGRGGGASGGSRGGSSGGRSGGSSGGRGNGGASGSRGNTASGSNVGGTSRGGTGPQPRFAGGQFYGGGATRPYRSGGISPLGIAPFALAGAALAFWPGLWLFGAHMYPYNYVHHYRNDSSNRNETANVLCGCAQFAECGCDENNNTAYYNDLIGNGSYDALNKSVVNVGEFRGNKTLLINGTLPNGTTADGADENAAGLGPGPRSLIEAAGLWPAFAAIIAAVFMA